MFMECICRSDGEVVVRLSYFDIFLDLPSLISCKCCRFTVAQPLIITSLPLAKVKTFRRQNALIGLGHLG